MVRLGGAVVLFCGFLFFWFPFFGFLSVSFFFVGWLIGVVLCGFSGFSFSVCWVCLVVLWAIVFFL